MSCDRIICGKKIHKGNKRHSRGNDAQCYGTDLDYRLGPYSVKFRQAVVEYKHNQGDSQPRKQRNQGCVPHKLLYAVGILLAVIDVGHRLSRQRYTFEKQGENHHVADHCQRDKPFAAEMKRHELVQYHPSDTGI